MHYLKDWQPVFREFHRILNLNGVLVFSTHHPFMDWKLHNKEDYFAVELLEDEWEIGKVRFYRRPLTAISQALDSTGFFIERLLEPQPTEDFRRVHPEGMNASPRTRGFSSFVLERRIRSGSFSGRCFAALNDRFNGHALPCVSLFLDRGELARSRFRFTIVSNELLLRLQDHRLCRAHVLRSAAHLFGCEPGRQSVA